jgi:hypothetical protein
LTLYHDRHHTNSDSVTFSDSIWTDHFDFSKVWEETGFDVSGMIIDEDYVEQTIKDQRIRLYIIKGVSESTVFEPQTRKEISVSQLIGFKTHVVCT